MNRSRGWAAAVTTGALTLAWAPAASAHAATAGGAGEPELKASAALAGSPARRCLWPGRACHPPARLWYRVSLRLDARLDYRSPPGALYSGPSPRPYYGVVPGTETLGEVWELESDNAVRLTLACVDLDVPDVPFLIERRVNGRRRPVGGCGRGAPARLRPSARFTALAAGAVVYYRRQQTIEPFTIANGDRCDGHVSVYTLTKAAGLGGMVRTDSSMDSGLVVNAFAIPPTGTAYSRADERRCTPPGRDPYVYFAARDENRPIAGPTIVGEEYVHPSAAIGWTPAPALVRFALRPSRFGRAFVIRRPVRQPQIDQELYGQAPLLPQFGLYRKDYVYTLRLTPCPNRGLDVGRC